MKKTLLIILLFVAGTIAFFLSGCAATTSIITEKDERPYWCDYDYGKMWLIWIEVIEGPPKHVNWYWQCENCHDIVVVKE